jgi:two-component system sensor histidine kinase and response regulator WspE
MSEAELFEFLFLPGFTLKDSVSEISGRGVGLDVVQTMVKEVGGSVRVSSQSGQGTRFQLELPITLSVIRTMLVEIGSEPYAFPLARIDTAIKLSKDQIQSLEGRQHFTFGEQQIGLVAASQVLELESRPANVDVSIIVLGDKTAHYGLVVDRFLGEQELVVRTLDPRLGKVQNISAAALMPDGSPVLIIDVDDLIRHIENVASGARLTPIGGNDSAEAKGTRKRVLVVDDSLVVRELERKVLDSRGYAVDVAVDGMDGWNAVRTGNYDLVVTDVDMPRLDGIELVTLIRKDSRLKSLSVMIVSYKDREEDRQRGLEAGADYYLTKGSFHDETLVTAVADLIGRADC